jgi:hypothetical protein
MKSIRIAVVIIWAVSLAISFLPACPIPYFGDNYYGRSSVCIALPITNERPPGNQQDKPLRNMATIYYNIVCQSIIAVL